VINFYIKSFFILIIIEISKLLEIDDNTSFKDELNKKIPITKYHRVKFNKYPEVTTISEQIIHFRDACVHNKNLGISQNTQAKKAGLNLDGIHLDFTCD
jgi:hypothetical protein